MLDAEKAPELRRQLTGALGQAREPGTVEAMRALARDADPKVRAEAVHWFAARGGAPVVGEVVKLIETETDAAVQRRALSGLGAVPDAGGIAPLIQLARTAKDPAVRKEAVRVLSRSADPRATAFMEELIKR
jgi:HEAT repeat protein